MEWHPCRVTRTGIQRKGNLISVSREFKLSDFKLLPTKNDQKVGLKSKGNWTYIELVGSSSYLNWPGSTIFIETSCKKTTITKFVWITWTFKGFYRLYRYMIIMMFWLTDIKLWNNKVKKEHVNLHEWYTKLSLLKTIF